MKKIKILFFVTLILICIVSSIKKNIYPVSTIGNDTTYVDTILSKDVMDTKIKFHKINKAVEDSFVIVFNSVLKTFELDKHKDYLIAQILVESKGNQYYTEGSKEGLVLTGTSGEKGVSQILPSAALSIMKLITPEDKEKMIKLGAKDFSKIKTKEDAKIWLNNINNNIIMYGFIMRYFMNYYNNNVKKSLVAYNTGQGGLKMYLDTGATLEKHRYYKALTCMKNKL